LSSNASSNKSPHKLSALALIHSLAGLNFTARTGFFANTVFKIFGSFVKSRNDIEEEVNDDDDDEEDEEDEEDEDKDEEDDEEAEDDDDDC
jgi:hypothetical protein